MYNTVRNLRRPRRPAAANLFTLLVDLIIVWVGLAHGILGLGGLPAPGYCPFSKEDNCRRRWEPPGQVLSGLVFGVCVIIA